jgi:hypothetical protein
MEFTQMQNRSFRCKIVTSLTACLATGAAFCMTLWSQEAYGKAPLGKNWPLSQLASMDQIDHSPFDALLKKHVDADGHVNYKEWKSSSKDRSALQDYLKKLGRASTKTRSSREAKIAFWINAYDAVTIEGILQVYPAYSIRNHTARLIGYNIWTELSLRVGGNQYPLENMEHKILRRMQEPRVHFAIVCASVGCPWLKNEAYTADKLEQATPRKYPRFLFPFAEPAGGFRQPDDLFQYDSEMVQRRLRQLAGRSSWLLETVSAGSCATVSR